MNHDYWQQKWEKQDIAWHQKMAHPFLQKYTPQLNLQPNDTILVPLCGKAKDMIWLAAQGYHVIGVELSPIACDDFFRELDVIPIKTPRGAFIHYQHQAIEIYCGDMFALTAERLPPIKAIFDCRALVALPAELHRPYVEHLFACAGNQARLLLLTVESSSEVTGPPFSVNEEAVKALFADQYRIQLVERTINPVVPKHLIAKGYKDFIEAAYLIEMTG